MGACTSRRSTAQDDALQSTGGGKVSIKVSYYSEEHCNQIGTTQLEELWDAVERNKVKRAQKFLEAGTLSNYPEALDMPPVPQPETPAGMRDQVVGHWSGDDDGGLGGGSRTVPAAKAKKYDVHIQQASGKYDELWQSEFGMQEEELVPIP